MNKQYWLFIVVAALMAGTAGAVSWLRGHQALGRPGIIAAPIPDSPTMKIELPARVLDYASEELPADQVTLDLLPKDTSFARRRYQAPDGFQVVANIVLMGADRTSIHKPEYCLPGQGWQIHLKTTDSIRVGGPEPYEMPVAKWIISNSLQMQDGRIVDARGIYLFWFVADGQQTASHSQRVWWLARNLLTTGVLQRWAYISYFSVCAPGEEEAALARMKALIGASVPAFQFPPGHVAGADVVRQ